MKFNYLFVNANNGHGNTYHPFNSNSVLNQERVTEWFMQIPGSGSMGTGLNDLLNRMDKEGLEFEPFLCPCCGKEVKQIENHKSLIWNVINIKWILIEGVSGNY